MVILIPWWGWCLSGFSTAKLLYFIVFNKDLLEKELKGIYVAFIYHPLWKLDCEESWALKNWCFWTVVLEKTLESPLDCKEIQPVHSQGDQPWDFFGRNDAKAETPVFWPPHAKSWLIGKDFDARRDWGQEEKGMTEDEMAGWHHRLSVHEFEWSREMVMFREGWRAVIHRVAKSRTRLSNWTELNGL